MWLVFVDYWKAQPGQKGDKADWEATWRNWCRREGSFQKQTPSKPGEIKVRGVSDAEKREAAQRAEFFAQMMKHPGKTEAELAAMMQISEERCE